MGETISTVTVAIPTYRRGKVLLATLRQLLQLASPADEVLVVDQTERHEPDDARVLESMADAGAITWLRLPAPSIPRAMNVALQKASGEIVFFLDDDVMITSSIVDAHRNAHARADVAVVVGQIIQPWGEVLPQRRHLQGAKEPEAFSFDSSEPHWVERVMAGNMSVCRDEAVWSRGVRREFRTSSVPV